MAFDLLLLEKRLPLRLNCNQNYYDMKILRESFLFIVVSLLMGGCNTTLKDEENVKDEQNSIELQALYSEIAVIDEKPWRTLDEAIEIASEVIMRDRPQMRSSNLRELFNIEVLSFNEGKEVRGGKSNEADSSVYVCNLGKNEGYVLVSRDRCVPELLAYAPSGALHVDSIDANHPLHPFIERLPKFYEEHRLAFIKKKRSIGERPERIRPRDKEAGGGSYSEPRTMWRELEWENQSTPAKQLVQSAWNQGVPYNSHAPFIRDGVRAQSGCVAVAVGQLLAYHKYPSNIDGYPINWELLTKYEYRRAPLQDDYKHPFHLEVGKLLRKIGDELHNQWGEKETGAYEKDIPPFLRKIGYNVPSNPIISYNEADVKGSLDRGLPVLVSGYSEKSTYLTGIWPFRKEHTKYDGGHEWLIDGYLPQVRLLQLVDIDSHKILSTKKETRLLVHCNWGWDGSCNGFFLSGVFEAKHAVIEDEYIRLKDENTRSSKNDKSNFQYRITIIPYIHP